MGKRQAGLIDQERLALIVKFVRLKRHIIQPELATETKISQSTLSRLEAASPLVSLDVLSRVFLALHIDIRVSAGTGLFGSIQNTNFYRHAGLAFVGTYRAFEDDDAFVLLMKVYCAVFDAYIGLLWRTGVHLTNVQPLLDKMAIADIEQIFCRIPNFFRERVNTNVKTATDELLLFCVNEHDPFLEFMRTVRIPFFDFFGMLDRINRHVQRMKFAPLSEFVPAIDSLIAELESFKKKWNDLPKTAGYKGK